MAVTGAFEDWKQRSGGIQAGGQEVVLRREWRVETNNVNDSAITVYTSGYLPARGSGHPDYPRAIADRYDITNRPESPKIWRAVVEYSTIAQGQLPQNKEIEPTLRVAEISWDAVQFRKPMEQAWEAESHNEYNTAFLNRTAPTNSAGDPFIPVPEMDDSHFAVSITKNLTSVPIWILDYQDAVNADGFFVDGIFVPRFCAKMQNIAVSPLLYENNILFRAVTLVMHLRRDRWVDAILDCGLSVRIKSSKPPFLQAKVRASDSEGVPVSEPVLLNEYGQRLDLNQPDPQKHYRYYLAYRQLPFGALPLG